MQRRVIVRGTLCEVTVTQLSRLAWVVVGEHHGRQIEADGASEEVALARWLLKARENI